MVSISSTLKIFFSSHTYGYLMGIYWFLMTNTLRKNISGPGLHIVLYDMLTLSKMTNSLVWREHDWKTGDEVVCISGIWVSVAVWAQSVKVFVSHVNAW